MFSRQKYRFVLVVLTAMALFCGGAKAASVRHLPDAQGLTGAGYLQLQGYGVQELAGSGYQGRAGVNSVCGQIACGRFVVASGNKKNYSSQLSANTGKTHIPPGKVERDGLVSDGLLQLRLKKPEDNTLIGRKLPLNRGRGHEGLGNLPLSPVPLPSALWLFASAVLIFARLSKSRI